MTKSDLFSFPGQKSENSRFHDSLAALLINDSNGDTELEYETMIGMPLLGEGSREEREDGRG